MTVLKDILDLFDRWPEWKAIRSTPKRVQDLEDRVAALENAIKARPNAESCPKCSAGALKFISEQEARSPLNRAGIKSRTYKCDQADCGYSTERLSQPDGTPYRIGGR